MACLKAFFFMSNNHVLRIENTTSCNIRKKILYLALLTVITRHPLQCFKQKAMESMDFK